MADEQQKQALSAFSLLVDAANAQQARSDAAAANGGKQKDSPPTAAASSAAGASQPAPAPSSATVEALKAAAAASAGGEGGGGGAMTVEERAAALRQAALAAQLQQRGGAAAAAFEGNGGAAASNWEAMEIQEALQREMMHREAVRRQQQAAAYMGLGGGSPFGGGGGSLAAAQEAEYLQQLRLEALVQQRRQETLAQLALAQELGMSPDMQAMLEAEQLRQAAMMRQEALLQAAAAGNNSAFGGGAGAANGGGMEGLLGALGAGGISEEGIILILQERERQRKLALLAQVQQEHQQQQQQAAAQQATPQAVGSSPGLTGASGLPLRGTGAGSGMERADLIGSVFAKNAAAATPTKAPSAPVPAPSQEEAAAAALAQEASPFATMMVGQDGSKTTILRCGARNMPMDHNVKTAYFVVPEDAKHGTELVCSHLKCRNAGTKFRYCVYCKVPVAKRNFAKRHRHAGKIPKSELPRDFDLLLEEEEAAEEAAAKVPQIKKWKSQELLDVLMGQNVPELQAGGQNIPKPAFSGEVLDTVVAKRQEAWDKLLLARPDPSTSDDPTAMAAWVLELLRVSDMEKIAAAFTPCVPVPTKNLKNKNPSLKKKKRKLLSKRSKSEEEKSSPIKTNGSVSPMASPSNIPVKKTAVEGISSVGKDESSDLERPPVYNPPPADDSSTSSEDSVDLRASKKART